MRYGARSFWMLRATLFTVFWEFSLYVAYWKVPHIGAFCITLQTAARSAVIVTGFRFIPYSIGVEKME